ncbi:lytic transglycosylase domain-containing protein [Rhodopila globiformis]|uniref:Transglycosylase SLT domain-containing protein n=1 Tax=Rhodopila globiformis TaxID=1071 RepID=A0A2S6NJU3_RHOGL|nr:hypothetical protein CCS01_08285 [Rhodopila globiformis]
MQIDLKFHRIPRRASPGGDQVQARPAASLPHAHVAAGRPPIGVPSVTGRRAGPVRLPWVRRGLRPIVVVAVLGALGACGNHATHDAGTACYRAHEYAPPGPPGDPWGPYVREASARFGVPEPLIRQVIRKESGGQATVVSRAGAGGLMQLMPATYDALRARYSLGCDRFDPHDNILAGTAYLREMKDRFGEANFLAAYNAGPNRLDQHLKSGAALPDETDRYTASNALPLHPAASLPRPVPLPTGSRPGPDDGRPGQPAADRRPPRKAPALEDI